MDHVHTYVSLWRIKPAWQRLSEASRLDFLREFATHLKPAFDAGIELLSWSRNEETTERRLGFDFMSVWRLPTSDYARKLEQFLELAGWHQYFYQMNASGQSVPQDDFFRLLAAPQETASD